MIQNPLLLSLCFGSGIILQILLFVNYDWSLEKAKRLLKSAGIGLLGILPGKHESHYVHNIYFHVCFCFVIFAVSVIAFYKKEILPAVTECSLLSYSLIFWFDFLRIFNPESGFDRTIFLVALIPSLFTLVVAFTVRTWSFKVNLFCYVWFLFLIFGIYVIQVSFGELAFIFNPENVKPTYLPHLFLTGMSFTYLTASCFYLYILVPIQGKNQTREQRMKIWRADAQMMAGRFVDYRMTALQALFILLLQGGIYASDLAYGWMPAPLLVNLSVILLPLVFSLVFRKVAPSDLKKVSIPS